MRGMCAPSMKATAGWKMRRRWTAEQVRRQQLMFCRLLDETPPRRCWVSKEHYHVLISILSAAKVSATSPATGKLSACAFGPSALLPRSGSVDGGRYRRDLNGEAIPRQAIRLTLRGREWTLDELESVYDDRWNFGEKATITVLKPGGLPAGWHRLKVAERLRISYLPFVPVTTFETELELTA